VMFTAVSYLYAIHDYLRHTGPGGLSVLRPGHMIQLCCCVYVLVTIRQHEHRFLSDRPTSPGLWLPPKEPVAWRSVLLVIAVIFVALMIAHGESLGSAFRSSGLTWWTLVIYFMSVIPLPPGACRSRTRVSWWRLGARAENA
jgi:hypothetical protein